MKGSRSLFAWMGFLVGGGGPQRASLAMEVVKVVDAILSPDGVFFLALATASLGLRQRVKGPEEAVARHRAFLWVERVIV